MTIAPTLSVVVVPYAGREYLARCLRALAQQRSASPEVVVPHDAELGDVSALRAEFPAVRWVPVPVPGRATPAALRAAGCRAARGDVVAITEDHCVPEPRWCASILEAHAGADAVVGGAVEKEGRAGGLEWALYLTDYARYMRPLPDGPAAYLTDCNVSYKRAALDAVRDVWADEFHETAVHWRLRERGTTLRLDPAIVVRQQRSVRLGAALRERFEHGRVFAGTRVAGAPLGRRAALAGAALLLPPVLTARAAATVLRKRRHLGALVRALPALALTTTAWAFGELVGYVTGRGGAMRTRASVAPAGGAS